MAFIEREDYDVQARDEILSILDTTGMATDVAERMAIDQIRQYISGRYDCDVIFAENGDERDMFIVMIVIDIALYHLWSKRAPKKIPEHRAMRYQDALDWLKAVGSGKISTDLPIVTVGDDDVMGDVLIRSKYKPNDNKY